MMRQLKRYMRKKKLEMNVGRRKIMIFRKGGRKGKEVEWLREEKKVAVMNEF